MFGGLRHHLRVLSESWRQESERRKDVRRSVEVDFLPAALEVIEKPPSPLGRIMMWTMLALFTAAVLWACLGHVDVVATAQGRLIPRERVKVVQAPEIGVVQAIHAEDGMAVKAGDVLVELDPTIAGADEASARQRLMVAEVAVARARALLVYLDEGSSPHFLAPKDVEQAVAETQQRLIMARAREFEATRDALVQERAERQAELKVIEREESKLAETVPLLDEQIAARSELLEKGLTPRLLFLEARERQVTMHKDLQIAGEQKLRTLAAIAAVERRIEQLTQEFRRTVVGELAEAESERAVAAQELAKAAQRKRMQTLKAPIDGIVQHLAVHTLGGVVEPAQPLMVIVPGKGELVIDALVLNKDVGFVEEGDLVEVKLEAFPFTKFGVIAGTLEDLSSDAIEDEHLGLVYQARIALAGQTIRVAGRDVRLAPGMASTAEIKTGKRRIIEFLLSPLLRYKDEALRER